MSKTVYEINKTTGELGVVTNRMFGKASLDNLHFNYSKHSGLHGFMVNGVSGDFEDFVQGEWSKEMGEKYHLDKVGFREAQMCLMHLLAEKALEHLRPSEA